MVGVDPDLATISVSPEFGLLSPIPIVGPEVKRILSLPPVSTVNVSAAGNLIAVLVSPL